MLPTTASSLMYTKVWKQEPKQDQVEVKHHLLLLNNDQFLFATLHNSAPIGVLELRTFSCTSSHYIQANDTEASLLQVSS